MMEGFVLVTVALALSAGASLVDYLRLRADARFVARRVRRFVEAERGHS